MVESEKRVVARLLDAPAGRASVLAGSDLVAPGVAIHVDGWTFRGVKAWVTFLDLIRSSKRVQDLTLRTTRMARNADGTVTAHGHWEGIRRGRPATSRELCARFRVDEGVVAEIWTARVNYQFVFGSLARFRLGWLVIAATGVVRRTYRGYRSPVSAAPARGGGPGDRESA